MAIAIEQVSTIGAKIFAPEGPLSNQTPGLLNNKFGICTVGDFESEFVFLSLIVGGVNVPVGTTLQQGALLAWDSAFTAYLPTTALAKKGDSLGTFFVGGRIGDAGGPYVAGTQAGTTSSITGGWGFNFTFTAAGVYGIWAQRSGASLLVTLNTVGSGVPVGASTTAGSAGVLAPATGLYITQPQYVFTANTAVGSAILANPSTFQGLEVGMGLSGTGVPAGSYIFAIDGTGVVMGNRTSSGTATATANGTAVSITAQKLAFTGNIVNGSTVITNVSNVSGIYPGTTLVTGLGVVNAVVTSIGYQGGSYTITIAPAATATANNLAITAGAAATGVGGLLLEAELHWPFIS